MLSIYLRDSAARKSASMVAARFSWWRCPRRRVRRYRPARSRSLDAWATRTRLRDSRGDVFALSALEAPERSLEQSEAAVPKSPLIFKKDKLHRPKIKLGYAVFKRRRLSGQTPIRRTSRYRARG